jgi:putative methionine-R-sulfoxide reductase with GAF domain
VDEAAAVGDGMDAAGILDAARALTHGETSLVAPLLKDGRLAGVLDLDSPEPGRFWTVERDLAEAVAALVAERSAV